MKKVIVLIALIFSSLCSWGQEVMYEDEGNGVLMLSVTEYKVKKKEAIKLAIVDAYQQILFRGIPGSKEYRRSLLGSEEQLTEKQKEYYDRMVNGGRIYSFINYSYLERYKRKEAVVKLTINMQALIDDMERNNLYKRFGLY